MTEGQITEFWGVFKEHLDKKQIELAAERYVDLLADYGVSDQTFKESLGFDGELDAAIYYYLDLDDGDSYDDEDGYDWDE